VAEVSMIGTTVALALENVIRDALQAGRRVIVSGASEEVRQRLGSLGLLGEHVEEIDVRVRALERALTFI